MASVFDEKSIKNQNKIYDVPEGTLILKEGEINLDMYKIVSGHVEMYTGYGTDNEVLIGMVGPGACFGEFGILTGQPAIYTIIAYSDVRIIRVTEGLMGQFIEENRDDILKIMKNMAANMMRMQHQINQLSQELEECKEGVDFSMVESDNLRNYVLVDNSDLLPTKTAAMHFLNRGKF
jgi:CRP-like cAMP-binding protein